MGNLRSLGLFVAACCCAVAVPTGCTDAQLYHLSDVPPQPNKVAFTGQVCTDNPAERQFPLRVVLVVDSSPLLPTGLDGGQSSTLVQNRAQAVRDLVSLLRGADTEFALIRYGGQSLQSPEGGFTANTALINEAAGALTTPVNCDPGGAGCRRTSLALSQATSLITGDLLSIPRGVRARTTYAMILVGQGPADDAILSAQTNAECDEACVLRARTAELRGFVLENGAANLQVHTYDVAQLSLDPVERAASQSQLTEISFAGAGEYVPICTVRPDGSVAPPGCGAHSYSFIGVDVSSARNVFVKKSFVIANLSAVHTAEGELPDSDKDGIPDQVELEGITDPTLRDTDGDGLSDKVELLLTTVGLRPTEVDEPPVCAPVTPTQDTDGDGLTDCEEMLLRLDPTLFDTDADGYPDLIEFLAGTNFLENDTLVDADFDGAPNGPELRAHTDPRSHDGKARAELAYLYRENDLGIRESKFSTQPRDITGVVVEEVGPATGVGNGLLVYLLEDRALAWRDPADDVVGTAVRVDQAGTYTLPSGCVDDENAEPADPQNPDPIDAEAGGCAGRYITVSVTPEILPPYPSDELLRVSIAERQCIDFRVRNVTLVHTLAADGRPEGENDIRIYFGQVPEDRPSTFGIFRVAQYLFKFIAPDEKEPNVADQPVESYRFVLFGD